MNSIAVIVPTFREAENLPELLARIQRALSPTGRPFRIIVVDDDSRDGTEGKVAEQAAAGVPVELVVRTAERGLSSAVLRGFAVAAADILVCMDADLSHPPEALPRLVETLLAGEAEFVIGSRYVPGASTDESWGMCRWLNSKVATLLARPFTNVRDPMAGFFALPRAVYERADDLSPIGYKIALELIVKCRVSRVAEVPIHFADRQHGESKLNLREQLNYLRHLARLAKWKVFG